MEHVFLFSELWAWLHGSKIVLHRFITQNILNPGFANSTSSCALGLIPAGSQKLWCNIWHRTQKLLLGHASTWHTSLAISHFPDCVLEPTGGLRSYFWMIEYAEGQSTIWHAVWEMQPGVTNVTSCVPVQPRNSFCVVHHDVSQTPRLGRLQTTKIGLWRTGWETALNISG